VSVRNGTDTLPPPATAAGRAAQPARADHLLHAWFVGSPDRTLCGQQRDPRVKGDPYENRGDPDDCLVCEALAQAYIDGRWRP
jgi:hypothetical protein